MAHRVTLIPGDGIGPELTEATRRVLEASGVEFDWDVQYAGTDVMDQNDGKPAARSRSRCDPRDGVALKGPITTPVGSGFRSVNVGLRKALDLYGQVRPCKSYEGVRSRFDDVDLVLDPREHRGPLRRNRVRAGQRRGRGADRVDRGRTVASSATATRGSRSSRSRSPARAGSSSSRSTTRARTDAARSRPSTRRTS